MDTDISGILRDWPYEPGKVGARRIRGSDGKDRIQLRLDLGLLQMTTTGRPDGKRPHGHESLLAYHEHRLGKHTERHGTEEGFSLDEQACELLRIEGVMFYHRYLAEFILEDYEGVERDTMRNLRQMDFCRAYAEAESDRYVLEQYRPYVLMMCARARARIALRDNRLRSALTAVRWGIEQMESFFRRFGQEELIPQASEIAVLRAMEKEIQALIPLDPVQKVRRRLDRAVRDERYEEAASLRDQLFRITGEQPRNLNKS